MGEERKANFRDINNEYTTKCNEESIKGYSHIT